MRIAPHGLSIYMAFFARSVLLQSFPVLGDSVRSSLVDQTKSRKSSLSLPCRLVRTTKKKKIPKFFACNQ